MKANYEQLVNGLPPYVTFLATPQAPAPVSDIPRASIVRGILTIP